MKESVFLILDMIHDIPSSSFAYNYFYWLQTEKVITIPLFKYSKTIWGKRWKR